MVKQVREVTAGPVSSPEEILAHPALSSFERNERGFAVGPLRGRSALRAPENLKAETEILRFGIGLFSALACLEAEEWPFAPKVEDWTLAWDGLPAYSLSAAEPSSENPCRAHGALLHRLLAGKRAAAGDPLGAIPKRHRAAALWNGWFKERLNEGSETSCRYALLGLWSLAERAGLKPALPPSWGVASSWPHARPAPGLKTISAPGAHALQFALMAMGMEGRVVRLGDMPPYPFASLEPIVSVALGEERARSWMGQHLRDGGGTLASSLRDLLRRDGSPWLLLPAEAFDHESLRTLAEACDGIEVPVTLLAKGRGDGDRDFSPLRIHLPWLTPAAEVWYQEHAGALLGGEKSDWLRVMEDCPEGEPRCGKSLIPPLAKGLLAPFKSFLGGRPGRPEGGAPEVAAEEGRLADLLAIAGALGAAGDVDARTFWEGVALTLLGQPAIALAKWDSLGTATKERGRLDLYRARAFERIQDFDLASEALKRARTGSLSAADSERADLLAGQLLWIQGRTTVAEKLLRPIADKGGSGDARAQALCHLATQALHGNRTDEAMRLLECARDAVPATPLPLTAFLLLHRTGMAFRKVGDFERALAHFESARGKAASVGFRALEAWAECECGTALRQLFRFGEAIAAYERAGEGAVGLGLAKLAESSQFGLAICQAEAGDLRSAEQAFVASLEEDRDRSPVDRATSWYWVGWVRQQLGDYPGALDAAEAGLAALQGFEDPEVRFPLLVARGEILLLTGQFRKLSYLLKDLDESLLPTTEPNDCLAAAALKRAAAAKGEGTFTPADQRRAEEILEGASPYFRAHWHLLCAQAEREDPATLQLAWRAAKEGQSAHFACRALWGLAEANALPALDSEDRLWLGRFLLDNRVRGPEAGLLRFLGEASRVPGPPRVPLPEALGFLAVAEADPARSLDGLLAHMGATCGCLLAPGNPPRWWGPGTAEQRRALVAAVGLRGEAPGPGGRIIGHPTPSGLWCGVLRPGPGPFAPEAAALFRVWARLAVYPADDPIPSPTRAVHPAVTRLILTRSPAMADLLGKIERAAPFAFPVLITGEAGSGKEVCARAIHDASPRAGKPWVAANCANLSPTLAASQLFGHRKGAFTGADKDQAGLVETARGGTLFLDEVGEIALEVQAGLLRFLQDGSYTPLGESRERRSEARIVAATNRDLERAVADGRFREDLFHRIRVIPIEVPPLRYRPEDIPLLFELFLRRAAQEEGVRVPGVEPPVLARLSAYSWPGNVREIQNLARSLLVESHGEGTVREFHLPERLRRSGSSPGRTLSAQLEGAERTAIEEALKEASGNRAAAARLLGISRQCLFQKLRRHGLG